jgi:hypothetical protein
MRSQVRLSRPLRATTVASEESGSNNEPSEVGCDSIATVWIDGMGEEGAGAAIAAGSSGTRLRLCINCDDSVAADAKIDVGRSAAFDARKDLAKNGY